MFHNYLTENVRYIKKFLVRSSATRYTSRTAMQLDFFLTSVGRNWIYQFLLLPSPTMELVFSLSRVNSAFYNIADTWYDIVESKVCCNQAKVGFASIPSEYIYASMSIRHLYMSWNNSRRVTFSKILDCYTASQVKRILQKSCIELAVININIVKI